MKAASGVTIALITAASILTVIGAYSFSLGYKIQSVVRDVNEVNIIEAINQMTIKKGLQHALVYSSYQSAYETLKYGGYSTEECNPDVFAIKSQIVNPICPYPYTIIDGKCNECTGEAHTETCTPVTICQEGSVLYENECRIIIESIPYWRTGDATCLPNNNKLNKALTEKFQERFAEYIKALREQADEIGIQIPDYQSITTEITDNQVNVQASSNDKLKLISKNLEITDNANVKATIHLRITDLINKAIDHFITNDPVKQKIEESNEQMLEESVSSGNLNTGKRSGTCKSVSFQLCKEITPEEAFQLPTKSQILPNNCENNFVNKIRNNIDNLNFDTETIDVSLMIKIVKSDVDNENELTCNTAEEPNSNRCDCIEWVCTGSKPVKFGSVNKTKPIGESIRVGANDQCASCISENEASDTCVQWEEPSECQNGYVLREDECVELVNPICPSPYRMIDGQCNNCRITPPHDVETCTPVTICPPGSTSHNNECWGSTTSKICRTGTVEFQNTGRCYNLPSSPTCQLRETLYIKTCTYDYSAEADVLVTVRDTENKYPVYDKTENKPDLKNLELDIAIRSGNLEK